jgi:regulator of extracellular matrix RemA (YlzA/DUF370 family)
MNSLTNTIVFFGRELKINPVAFNIGDKPVYWYGVIIAAGFLLAIIYGKFRIQEVVGDACRLGVLIDASFGRVVERLAVGREASDIVAIASGFAHLQATLMCGIVDAEHIDQLQLE